MEAAYQNVGYLLKAARITLEMSVATVLLGFLVGTLLGVFAALGNVMVRKLLMTYVYLVRGVPVLVLIFIAYFCLPKFGINASNNVDAIIALVLYFAAFVTGIVRGSILAVPRTAVEAGKSIELRDR